MDYYFKWEIILMKILKYLIFLSILYRTLENRNISSCIDKAERQYGKDSMGKINFIK